MLPASGSPGGKGRFCPSSSLDLTSLAQDPLPSKEGEREHESPTARPLLPKETGRINRTVRGVGYLLIHTQGRRFNFRRPKERHILREKKANEQEPPLLRAPLGRPPPPPLRRSSFILKGDTVKFFWKSNHRRHFPHPFLPPPHSLLAPLLLPTPFLSLL